MNDDAKISMPALERLATYLRYLCELEQQGVSIICSADIEEAMGISASQFRKDLSYLGAFGTPGIGYDVHDLCARIAGILNVEREQPVLLVGAGNLGSALAGRAGVRSHKFNIVAVFDNNYNKIGRQLWDLQIMDVDCLKRINAILRARMAIVAVPATAAQGVVDQLVDAGVEAILNFAPTTIRVPDEVVVRHVCFIQELTVLSFCLSHKALEDTAQRGLMTADSPVLRYR